MFAVSLSELHSNTDLIFFDFQIFLKMRKTTRDFLDPSFYVLFCASYLAEFTAQVREGVLSSSDSPPIVTGLLLFMLAFMIFVLLLLMLSPVCVYTVFRSSVLSCI